MFVPTDIAFWLVRVDLANFIFSPDVIKQWGLLAPRQSHPTRRILWREECATISLASEQETGVSCLSAKDIVAHPSIHKLCPLDRHIEPFSSTVPLGHCLITKRLRSQPPTSPKHKAPQPVTAFGRGPTPSRPPPPAPSWSSLWMTSPPPRPLLRRPGPGPRGPYVVHKPEVPRLTTFKFYSMHHMFDLVLDV